MVHLVRCTCAVGSWHEMIKEEAFRAIRLAHRQPGRCVACFRPSTLRYRKNTLLSPVDSSSERTENPGLHGLDLLWLLKASTSSGTYSSTRCLGLTCPVDKLTQNLESSLPRNGPEAVACKWISMPSVFLNIGGLDVPIRILLLSSRRRSLILLLGHIALHLVHIRVKDGQRRTGYEPLVEKFLYGDSEVIWIRIVLRPVNARSQKSAIVEEFRAHFQTHLAPGL